MQEAGPRKKEKKVSCQKGFAGSPGNGAPLQIIVRLLHYPSIKGRLACLEFQDTHALSQANHVLKLA